jgi:glutamate 5-kinase
MSDNCPECNTPLELRHYLEAERSNTCVNPQCWWTGKNEVHQSLEEEEEWIKKAINEKGMVMVSKEEYEALQTWGNTTRYYLRIHESHDIYQEGEFLSIHEGEWFYRFSPVMELGHYWLTVEDAEEIRKSYEEWTKKPVKLDIWEMKLRKVEEK